MKPYTPIEPSAKMTISPMSMVATAPLIWYPWISQPSPNGMTLKASSAVKAEKAGATMYGIASTLRGKNASFRTSFSRSAIGCSRPDRQPARFGP